MGNLDKASEVWEQILIEHPTDLLSLKLGHAVYYYMGEAERASDTIARVLPEWRTSDPLYGFLHGMHSFALVQSNLFERARASSLHALELNADDAWAMHTLSHCNEYACAPDVGINVLRDNEANWSPANLLATHNYWHWCLFHIERGEHDAALELYNKHMAQSHNRMLDMIDVVSLLYRLQLDGCPVPKEKWLKVKQVCC